MILIEYSLETQISAIFTIISMIFALTLAIIVIIKIRKTKEKFLYWFFFIIIGLFSMYFIPTIAYFYWLFTTNPIPYELHVIGYNIIYPFAIFSWLVIYTAVVFIEKKKIILSICMISIILFEIYLFYFLYFAPNAPIHELLGNVEELKTTNSGGLIIFGMFFVGITFITSIHYSIYTIKNAPNKERLWRGRILFIAFIFLAISLTLEALTPPSEIFLVLISRISLMISSFLLFLGFSPPKWFRNYFSQNESK